MRAFLDLLLPPVCPGCRREGEVLCAACRSHLERRLGEPAGVPIGLANALPRGLVQSEWCAAFSGPARAALLALKYDGERRLAEPLGELLARRWSQAGAGGDTLVPVPIHPERRRERGFDQAELLAQVAGRHLRLPVVPALMRRQRTAAQHSLGRAERADNVGGAFAVRPGMSKDVGGRWLVLVDDVATTGATLSGCAAALHAAGALAVSAITLARER
ncbi:ComF family protein [soil metagenome]